MAKLTKILQKAQQYAAKNPDKVGKFADKAADFADKRTKGKYSGQIGGAVRKLDAFTGNDRRRDDRRDDPRFDDRRDDPRFDDRGGRGGGSAW